MTVTTLTMLGVETLQRGYHAPGDAGVIARDPWGLIGLAFMCVSRYVLLTMAGKLNELGGPSWRMIRWGVSTRYRKLCRNRGWSPWLPDAMWIFLCLGVACIIFGIYKIHH